LSATRCCCSGRLQAKHDTLATLAREIEQPAQIFDLVIGPD